MRQLRFIAIGLVTFLFVTSAVFLRKIIAVFLCGVLSFNSASCYSYLGDYGEANATSQNIIVTSLKKTVIAQNDSPKIPDYTGFNYSKNFNKFGSQENFTCPTSKNGVCGARAISFSSRH